jgi:hypothetical protein
MFPRPQKLFGTGGPRLPWSTDGIVVKLSQMNIVKAARFASGFCIAKKLWTWPDLSPGLVQVSSLAMRLKFIANSRVRTEAIAASVRPSRAEAR